MITVLAYSETTSGNCPECGHLSSRASTAGITAPSPTCPGADAASGWWCGCIASSAPGQHIGARPSAKLLRLWLSAMRAGPLASGSSWSVLAMSCSPDTVPRLLHRLPGEPVEAPRVVSLDNWAWRRGHRYGTLIRDLERHRRLDVLPDREVASVAAWLRRYPSSEIISRDRSDTSATAARPGAPQALQVTDKRNLLK